MPLQPDRSRPLFPDLRLRFVGGELCVLVVEPGDVGGAPAGPRQPGIPASDPGGLFASPEDRPPATSPSRGSRGDGGGSGVGGGGAAAEAMLREQQASSSSAPWPDEDEEDEDEDDTVTASPRPDGGRDGPALHPGLGLLEAFLGQALEERRRLEAEMPDAIARRDAAHHALQVAEASILPRLLRPGRLGRLREHLAAETEAVRDLAARLAACRVRLGLDFDAPVFRAFAAFAEAHARLAGGGGIWDLRPGRHAPPGGGGGPGVTAGGPAGPARVPVSFGAAPRAGVIAATWPGLRLTDAGGTELDIFPGFYLLQDGGDGNEPVVGDPRDLEVEVTPVRFREAPMRFKGEGRLEDEGGASRDAAEVSPGHGRARGGEDGSPDQREPDDRRRPPPGPPRHYGHLILRGPGGLDQSYLIERHDAAVGFTRALGRLQAALEDLARRSVAGPVTPMADPPAEIAGAAAAPDPYPITPPPPRPERRRVGQQQRRHRRVRQVASLAGAGALLLLGGGLAALLSEGAAPPPGPSDGGPEPARVATGPGPVPPPVARSDAATGHSMAPPVTPSAGGTGAPLPPPPAAAPAAMPPPSPAPSAAAPPPAAVAPPPAVVAGPPRSLAPAPPPPPPVAVPSAPVAESPVAPPPPAPPSSVAAPASTRSGAEPGSRLTMALGANVRAGPGGGAQVLRTVNAGTRVLVFARSGGWLQIGDEEPWGWVHASRAEPGTGGGGAP